MATRVLYLNTRDQCGADVAVHLTLMRHFAPSEAEVFVLSNSEASDADAMRATFAQMPHVDARFVPLGRPADALAGRGKLGKLAAFVPTVRSMAGALAFVRRHRIQVIHATDRPRDASLAALLGRLTGVPAVVHMHSSFGPHLSRPTLWGFEKASAIFAVSDFTRAGLIGMGIPEAKVHTLHNATDTEHFDPDRAAGSGAAVRERFGVPADAPLLGIVARINPWKGQRETIAALGELSSRHPQMRLMVVGAGPAEEEAALRAAASAAGVADRVILAGRHDDVRPFLDAFDLFVHPSFEEPFGLAITEAMSMRKPVIACDSGALPEIVRHGEDGWLAAPRSSEAVAAGIARLWEDPALRARMGEAARRTVQARFTPRIQCAHAAGLYAALAGGTAPATA